MQALNAARAVLTAVMNAGDAVSAPLREVVHRLDANIPTFNVRTMDALYQMRATRVFDVAA